MLLELTPIQRLEAIRTLGGDSKTNPVYTGLGVIAIIILLILLVIINRHQKNYKQKSSHQMFAEYAQKHGLTERESQLLWSIALKADLQRSESIFTLPTAFHRGDMKLLQECLVEHGSEESERLQVELSFLREKLGFNKKIRSRSVVASNPSELSSRQIPAGKKIYIRHHRAASTGDIESVIIQSSPKEMTVQLGIQVEVAFGHSWRCRYYSGDSLWEFDTTVLSCSGNVVSLQHSNEIRLINRRKFLRVPAQQRAAIARYPFIKRAGQTGIWPRKKTDLFEQLSNNPVDLLTPPVFTPAVVTELGGPGLRVMTHLNVKNNDRVLILFILNQTKTTNYPTDAQLFQDTADEKVIESIATVRHTKGNQEDGFSIALELIGLEDDDIDELIRATNEASIGIEKRKKQTQAMELV